MRVVGIDPGKTGALVLMDGTSILEMQVMPKDSLIVRDMLLDWDPNVVYIEKAQSSAKGGVTSMFNYGRDFGEIVGILKALKISHVQVPPVVWCKVMHQGASRKGTAKDRSLQVALRLFPEQNFLATKRSYVPHDGLIDGSLIAYYGRQQEYAKGNQ